MSGAVSPGYNRSERVNTYICLDKLTALLSYSAHKAKDIQSLFCVHHVDHAVNDNERPSPPNPGAAQTQTRRRHKVLAKSGYKTEHVQQHCIYIVFGKNICI